MDVVWAWGPRGAAAFVVEVAAGSLTPRQMKRHTWAVLALAAGS